MKKQIKAWKCILCGTGYPKKNGADLAATCLWIHILRQDKHYKKMTWVEAPKKGKKKTV